MRKVLPKIKRKTKKPKPNRKSGKAIKINKKKVND